ncbi:MAG: hypothetical protein J5883_01765 [Clostridiales bacterium]|nr:hypothetical protein [Clostridiales bacterium]
MKKEGSKLSPLPYLKHNRRRAASLIVSLGVFAMMIYALGYLLASTAEPFEQIVDGGYKRYTLFYRDIEIGEYETNEEWYEMARPAMDEECGEARADSGNDDIYVVRVGSAPINSVIGSSGVKVFYFDTQDEVERFGDHMGATLVSGRMPEAPGELLVDTNAYKNNGEHLLDYLSGSYKIVGQVESPYYLIYGIPMTIENNLMLMAFHEDESYSIKDILEDKGWSIDYLDDYKYESDASKDVIEDLNNIKVIFTAVAGSLLSICVLVVLGLHIRDRHEEWCLYNSIGFSVGEIYIMALKELLISFALAIAFGALVTGVLIGCLKAFLVDPMGLPLNPARPGDMKMVGIMLITVFALCQIPVFWQMRTITTVDEIE